MDMNQGGLLVWGLVSGLFVVSAFRCGSITGKEDGRSQGSVVLEDNKSEKGEDDSDRGDTS